MSGESRSRMGVAIVIGLVVIVLIAVGLWVSQHGDGRDRADAASDQDAFAGAATTAGSEARGETHDSARRDASATDASGAHGVDHTVRDRVMHDDVRARILAAWAAAANSAPANGASGAADNDASAPASHLDPTYIRSLIRDEFLPMARDCYDQQLARTHDAAGRMTLRFVIMADEHAGGIVDDVQSEDPDAGPFDDAFHTCMRETMRTMVFRAPEGGGRITVRYPFVFAQGDGGS